jgi:hypothetical protein
MTPTPARRQPSKPNLVTPKQLLRRSLAIGVAIVCLGMLAYAKDALSWFGEVDDTWRTGIKALVTAALGYLGLRALPATAAAENVAARSRRASVRRQAARQIEHVWWTAVAGVAVAAAGCSVFLAALSLAIRHEWLPALDKGYIMALSAVLGLTTARMVWHRSSAGLSALAQSHADRRGISTASRRPHRAGALRAASPADRLRCSARRDKLLRSRGMARPEPPPPAPAAPALLAAVEPDWSGLFAALAGRNQQQHLISLRRCYAVIEGTAHAYS